MGRLRTKLRHHYDGQGAADRVLINVPTGSYVPSFSERTESRETAVAHDDRATPARLAVLPFLNIGSDGSRHRDRRS